MIIENYDIDAVKRRYIDDPLINTASQVQTRKPNSSQKIGETLRWMHDERKS